MTCKIEEGLTTCMCGAYMCVGKVLTCVWYEGDFEERTNHARDVARLVVPQDAPLIDHQTVHGNPHITIAAHKHTRNTK